MLQTAKKLYALLHPGDRSKVILLILLMIVTAFVQTAGVASIMPFLAVLSDPGMIEAKPWLSHAYNSLGFSSSTAFLQFLGIAAFIVFVTGTALQAFTQWAVTRYSSLQQYHLSYRLMDEYLRRPYEFYLLRNSGDLSKTVLQETGQAVATALLPAMRLLSYTLLAVSVVTLLIVVEPWLALGVATGLGAAYGTIYLLSKQWLSRIGKDRVAANRERFTTASEAFAGAKEIRLLGRERNYLERFGNPSRRFAMHQANVTLLSNLPQYAIEGAAFGGVLLLVLYLMSDGGIATALPLIGLYGLAGKQLIPAFQKIFSTIAVLRFNMPAVDAVLEDLDTTATPSPAQFEPDPTPLNPQCAIVLQDVTYRYPETDKAALEDLNINIPVNTTIGLVGSSGAGKSTLVDLILGLLKPESGEVRIDDTVLGPANIRNWQATLGYVPQSIFLADQSIAANIALGLPADRIDRQAVERAARLANLHDFVTQELPEGYDTIIGERGVRLSGGQRQRIGIARALYRDPSVLIFDEATSALDNTTERAVMEAIHNLSGSKTIILVAHRLTTVQSCDRILVLHEGKIVEQGNWESLISQGRIFQRLATGALGAAHGQEPHASAAER
ncbi:ABC transporter ATP-binding protein [Azoarcus taiwanensis]|uniref:ATP-binding cassette domain-containing protein n=1 Tax=Azoarcus taiwanensis TaxID=666964 RepID=A0A972FGB0_9RHOO|nr:ABC transporter ATP-binding protein [Azoarcus taiwanensis]NMG01816.1 ATP-binding cassette domain-containing protein [Azoarcus taiwanensis]